MQDLLRRFTSIISAPGSFPRCALGLIDLAAFVSVEPFRELLERNLKLSVVRSSSTMLRIVLTNWTTGEARTFI